jgi:hypothetical protein
MNNFHASQPIRENLEGWSTIDSGDNSVEILECQIRVDNFSQAVDITNDLSPLVMQYEPLDSEYTIRVNLTRWVVEVRMSAPTGRWESEKQEILAMSISKMTSLKQ